MVDQLQSRLRALKNETYALILAARDPRTPWLARGMLLLVAAYAISPLDLIPDFIPVFGYLDDLIIVPAGIGLALRLIPAEVMLEARERSKIQGPNKRLEMIGTLIILLAWILAIIGLALLSLHFIREKV